MIITDSVQPGPARGGFRGYIVPGPGPRGPERVQVSALNFGIAPKYRNQTCLQQKYQSAYSVLVISRYFCYTAFTPLGHPIVADLIKKRGKCVKSHTLAPKLTFCFMSRTSFSFIILTGLRRSV